MSKFGGKEDDTENDSDSGKAMELVAEEAPEPVPDRKTSDEMIVQMAESTLENDETRTACVEPENETERTEEPMPEYEDVPECEAAPTEESSPEWEDDMIEAPVPEFEEHNADPSPELDDWTEEASPEYEDETDGIREE